jgi:glycosyltransferase involved in cell wall biosynthesis
VKREEKELWLFTMRFPYGRSEPFLENELPYLCERFKIVRLFPMFVDDGIREIPDNASVDLLLSDPYAGAGLKDLLKYRHTWTMVMRSVKKSAPDKAVLKRQKSLVRSRFRQALHRALVLKQGLFQGYDPGCVVLYSYWNYDWALVLSVLKTRDARISFVTRMLGFDMFKFRSPDGWPAFMEFQLEMADANYIISSAGMEHMLEHYGRYRDQFHLAYLATHDHGDNPIEYSGSIRIVSCANMVPLKRIGLLVEALKHISGQVEWTHFGDGPEMISIQEAVAGLSDNVRVDLRGSTSNKDILNWYRNTPVDLFVHTSSTEGGVPVALQEAASFGIPLIGTNVGGIPEIVGETTGELVPEDVSPEDLAATIEKQFQRFTNDPDQRKTVKQFWNERFRADIVYREFADCLIKH